jgi:hypothetical protein
MRVGVEQARYCGSFFTVAAARWDAASTTSRATQPRHPESVRSAGASDNFPACSSASNIEQQVQLVGRGNLPPANGASWHMSRWYQLVEFSLEVGRQADGDAGVPYFW